MARVHQRPPPHLESFLDLLGLLSRHLQFLREEGLDALELEPAAAMAWNRLQDLGSQPTSADERPSQRPAPAPPPSGALSEIAERIARCTRCPLHRTRTRPVPGQGCVNPDIAFVGEGPGADEDRAGLAFVGRAGQLLTQIIEAMGYTRDQVWIGNVVKCRPPGNRVPLPDEMEACLPFLREQLEVLKPKVIVCLGATAVRGLLHVTEGITRLRGKWLSFQGIDVMPTFHPAYLLRNPADKRAVWDDMKAVLERLGREPPPRPRREPR